MIQVLIGAAIGALVMFLAFSVLLYRWLSRMFDGF